MRALYHNLLSIYSEANRKSETIMTSLLGPREKSSLGEDSIQALHTSVRETGSDTPSSLHPREEGVIRTHSLVDRKKACILPLSILPLP